MMVEYHLLRIIWMISLILLTNLLKDEGGGLVQRILFNAWQHVLIYQKL
jgi:hypothetical protein